MHVDGGIGAGLDVELQEKSQVVRSPFHRLRQSRKSNDVLLEMGLSPGLHMQVAAANADPHAIDHPISDKSFELETRSLAVFWDWTAEIAGEIADAQPVRIGAVYSHRGKPRGFPA